MQIPKTQILNLIPAPICNTHKNKNQNLPRHYATIVLTLLIASMNYVPTQIPSSKKQNLPLLHEQKQKKN